MATFPTPDSPSPTPGVFSPRSPWFWLISGIGTLALAVIVIVILTVTGVLPDRSVPRPPLVVRDKPVVEAPPPRDLLVPPGERQRVIKAKLTALDVQLQELNLKRQQIRAALAAASASRATSTEVDLMRPVLMEVDTLWQQLNTQRDNLSAELRGS